MDTNTSYDKTKIVHTIKNYLAQYDKTNGKVNKIKLILY